MLRAQDDMDNAEKFVKFAVRRALEECPDDLNFFAGFYEKGLLDKLQGVVSKDFARVEYSKAIEMLQVRMHPAPHLPLPQPPVGDVPLLAPAAPGTRTDSRLPSHPSSATQEEIAKDPSKWEFPEVEFGTDLATEHERWLAETAFGRATFVYNYPKAIKSFYMRDNDDGRTVAAMDLLVPGVGELIGGSQREERLEMLQQKMADAGLDEKDYWWYLDLRRYGSVPHSGYGLGFERLVCYVTGMANIRDAVAFPRYPGSCEF